MSFLWPTMLLFLLLIPLFIGLYIRLQQRRKQAAARFSSFGLASGDAGRSPGIRQHVPPALFLAGLAILALAMARPQTVVSLPRVEGTVILAFDISGSMAADDLKPTRMEAAKNAARQFVERQPASVKVGVVAFSDGGLAVQPPTDDQRAILASIDRLTPQRGTSLANGILASLRTIATDAGLTPPETGSGETDGNSEQSFLPEGSFKSAIIVLLTDGENNEPPDPLAAAQAAVDHSVRIYTIGIGSPAGAVLEVEGFSVHTQLDEGLLQQIAQITGGSYFNAGNEEDLRTIYENITPQLVIKPEKMEVTSLFASASILVLLIGGAFSLVWFNRLP